MTQLALPPVGILAGGLGTRLAEETEVKPKPMVEVGGMPLLWHLMKSFSAGGVQEFVIALGYKSTVVKDFFLNYRNRGSDLRIDLGSGHVQIDRAPGEDWRIHLLDTGLETQTGGRVRQLLESTRRRMIITYGDGLSNIDIRSLLDFHQAHGKLATVTAVRPPARFGEIEMSQGQVVRFAEKPQVGEGWINGGFFVL
ncbi:MAG TPA: sugar phosphate nucleotidyltransferase, partial [Polyangiaceae bacterium]|nr:sugar phosphate nucleotidyltransferase [Polyangiaceae bacterium]